MKYVLSLLLLAMLACGVERTNAEAEPPEQFVEQQHEWPSESAIELDLLFVIDNSSSMADELESIANNLPRFVDVLENIGGCKPSLHIAVVSTDLGAGPYEVLGCRPEGDRGVFQTEPRLPGCSAPSDTFIRDVTLPNGARETNFDGTLTDALTCIAPLGAAGCNFPQPLEAMQRALDGSNAANAGFLRPDAFLMVIFISDGDDCSASDSGLFDPSDSTVNDPLGPLSSFRCFDFGVECAPDNPRQTGSKAACAPREDSSYLFGVGDYVDFLSQLRDDQDVLVAAAIGNTEPVIVVAGADGNPELAVSCQSAAGSATPAIRLREFVESFPLRNSVVTVCNEDLTDLLTVIARRSASMRGVRCLRGDLLDANDKRVGVQPECAISETLYSTDGAVETVLPECANETDPERSDNTPCYVIVEAPDGCPETPTQFAIWVFPDRACLPGLRKLSVRCVLR